MNTDEARTPAAGRGTEQRIHRAVSADGTEIAGRVRGEGPPLVLVHGAIGDGETAWEALLPQLTDRFTCHLPSTRGRGLSGDHPDHSHPRLLEDVTAYVDSIDEPTGLVGWSGSGPWLLGAAADCDRVTGVVVHEPVVLGVGGDDDFGRLASALEQVGIAAADGRPPDAVHAFATGICTEDEITGLEARDFYQRWAHCIPAMLRFLDYDIAYQGPRSTDRGALGRVAVPVLLLRGAQTLLGTLFAAVEHYLADQLADLQLRELEGVGHFAPVLAPEVIAKELISFFAGARQDSAGQPA